MKKRFVLIAILAVFMLSLATVYAQGPGRGMRWVDDEDEFPELTADQKDQMAKLRLEHQKAMIPLNADLKLKRIEFRDMMRNDASQAELNRMLDDIGRLKVEISKMRLDHRLKMRNILTDEQREFLESHPRWHRFMDRFHKDGWGKGMRKFHRGPRGIGFDDDDGFESEDVFHEAFFDKEPGWKGDCPLN